MENHCVSDYLMNVGLPIKKNSESPMHFEQEWEMEVNDLPYKLEGWSKGQGLAKMERLSL